MCIYIYIYTLYIYIYIYICMIVLGITRVSAGVSADRTHACRSVGPADSHFHIFSSCRVPGPEAIIAVIFIYHLIRPVHLLRVSLLRVLESNFPGDSL